MLEPLPHPHLRLVPTVPARFDHRGWRLLLRQATTGAERKAVLATWAEMLRGELRASAEGQILVLPAPMPTAVRNVIVGAAVMARLPVLIGAWLAEAA